MDEQTRTRASAKIEQAMQSHTPGELAKGFGMY